MKSILTTVLVAVALSLTAAAAQCAEGAIATVGEGASSVTDMLQRKHATELRAHLVAAGRWDEIRSLDEATAQRMQEQREQRYVQLNEQLARSAGVDGPSIDARVLECDADATHVK